MAILDFFSKRQKRLKGEIPDVYIYDTIPQPLRVQIVHIWQDCLGNNSEYFNAYIRVEKGYKFIVEALRREYGVFRLTQNEYRKYQVQ